jgi:hypothetical protein
MNTLATAETTLTSEDINSQPVIDTVCFPKRLGTHTSCLSSEQDTFLRDRYSTKLEDPRTGRWIRSWRTEG